MASRWRPLRLGARGRRFALVPLLARGQARPVHRWLSELRVRDRLGPDIEFYRLDNHDGLLWSFTPKDLVYFDSEAS